MSESNAYGDLSAKLQYVNEFGDSESKASAAQIGSFIDEGNMDYATDEERKAIEAEVNRMHTGIKEARNDYTPEERSVKVEDDYRLNNELKKKAQYVIDQNGDDADLKEETDKAREIFGFLDDPNAYIYDMHTDEKNALGGEIDKLYGAAKGRRGHLEKFWDAIKRGFYDTGIMSAQAYTAFKGTGDEMSKEDMNVLKALQDERNKYDIENPGSVESIKDVKGVGDFVDYALGAIGENMYRGAVGTAAALATGGTAAYASGALGASAAAAGTAGAVGGVIGGSLGTLMQNTGEAVSDQVEDDVKFSRGLAALQGGLYSVLDGAFGIVPGLSKMWSAGLKMAGKEVAKNTLADPVKEVGKMTTWKYLGKELGKMAFGEGVTEGLQSGLIGRTRRYLQTGSMLAKDETIKDALVQFADEFLGGAIASVGMGAHSGIANRANAKAQHAAVLRVADNVVNTKEFQQLPPEYQMLVGKHIINDSVISTTGVFEGAKPYLRIENDAIDKAISEGKASKGAESDAAAAAELFLNSFKRTASMQTMTGVVSRVREEAKKNGTPNIIPNFSWESAKENAREVFNPDGSLMGTEYTCGNTGIRVVKKADGEWTVVNGSRFKDPVDAVNTFKTEDEAVKYAEDLSIYNEEIVKNDQAKLNAINSAFEKIFGRRDVNIVPVRNALEAKKVGVGGTKSFAVKGNTLYVNVDGVNTLGDIYTGLSHERAHGDIADVIGDAMVKLSGGVVRGAAENAKKGVYALPKSAVTDAQKEGATAEEMLVERASVSDVMRALVRLGRGAYGNVGGAIFDAVASKMGADLGLPTDLITDADVKKELKFLDDHGYLGKNLSNSEVAPGSFNDGADISKQSEDYEKATSIGEFRHGEIVEGSRVGQEKAKERAKEIKAEDLKKRQEAQEKKKADEEKARADAVHAAEVREVPVGKAIDAQAQRMRENLGEDVGDAAYNALMEAREITRGLPKGANEDDATNRTARIDSIVDRASKLLNENEAYDIINKLYSGSHLADIEAKLDEYEKASEDRTRKFAGSGERSTKIKPRKSKFRHSSSETSNNDDRNYLVKAASEHGVVEFADDVNDMSDSVAKSYADAVRRYVSSMEGIGEDDDSDSAVEARNKAEDELEAVIKNVEEHLKHRKIEKTAKEAEELGDSTPKIGDVIGGKKVASVKADMVTDHTTPGGKEWLHRRELVTFDDGTTRELFKGSFEGHDIVNGSEGFDDFMQVSRAIERQLDGKSEGDELYKRMKAVTKEERDAAVAKMSRPTTKAAKKWITWAGWNADNTDAYVIDEAAVNGLEKMLSDIDSLPSDGSGRILFVSSNGEFSIEIKRYGDKYPLGYENHKKLSGYSGKESFADRAVSLPVRWMKAYLGKNSKSGESKTTEIASSADVNVKDTEDSNESVSGDPLIDMNGKKLENKPLVNRQGNKYSFRHIDNGGVKVSANGKVFYVKAYDSGYAAFDKSGNNVLFGHNMFDVVNDVVNSAHEKRVESESVAKVNETRTPNDKSEKKSDGNNVSKAVITSELLKSDKKLQDINRRFQDAWKAGKDTSKIQGEFRARVVELMNARAAAADKAAESTIPEVMASSNTPVEETAEYKSMVEEAKKHPLPRVQIEKFRKDGDIKHLRPYLKETGVGRTLLQRYDQDTAEGRDADLVKGDLLRYLDKDYARETLNITEGATTKKRTTDFTGEEKEVKSISKAERKEQKKVDLPNATESDKAFAAWLKNSKFGEVTFTSETDMRASRELFDQMVQWGMVDPVTGDDIVRKPKETPAVKKTEKKAVEKKEAPAKEAVKEEKKPVEKAPVKSEIQYRKLKLADQVSFVQDGKGVTGRVMKVNPDGTYVIRYVEKVARSAQHPDGTIAHNVTKTAQELSGNALDRAQTQEEKAAYTNAVKEQRLVFKTVTDKDEISRLENDPLGYTEAYASAQLIDGKVYSPMAAYIDGKLTEPFPIGGWQKSEENPDLVDEKGKFKLEKSEDSSEDVAAAYNPYWHSVSMDSPLNDQFSTAYRRPNLVMIKVLIPNSDLQSGYKAEKAKDSVGPIKWKNGQMTEALQKAGKPNRVVFLSQYRKIVEVLSNEEAARLIAKQLEGVDIALPANVVSPGVRDILTSNYGIKLGKPTGNANQVAKYTRELSEQDVKFKTYRDLVRDPSMSEEQVTLIRNLSSGVIHDNKWYNISSIVSMRGIELNGQDISEVDYRRVQKHAENVIKNGDVLPRYGIDTIHNAEVVWYNIGEKIEDGFKVIAIIPHSDGNEQLINLVDSYLGSNSRGVRETIDALFGERRIQKGTNTADDVSNIVSKEDEGVRGGPAVSQVPHNGFLAERIGDTTVFHEVPVGSNGLIFDNAIHFKTASEESGIKVSVGKNVKTGKRVDFIDLMARGIKKGETRDFKKDGSKPSLPVGKWVGMYRDYDEGIVLRVKFGEPVEIRKGDANYKKALIKDTDFDIKDGGSKWYYPIVEKQDLRDNPQPINKTGNYVTYDKRPDMKFKTFVGEIGANNLDEKVRNDLSIAKDMLGERKWSDLDREEKKRIAFATGWQVGADGKWRHEMDDVKRSVFSGKIEKFRQDIKKIAIYLKADDKIEKLEAKVFDAEYEYSSYSEDYFYDADKEMERASEMDEDEVRDILPEDLFNQYMKDLEKVNKLQKKIEKAYAEKETLRKYLEENGLVGKYNGAIEFARLNQLLSDEVMNAYPSLGRIQVVADNLHGSWGSAGQYAIYIDKNHIINDSIEDITDTLVHEIQHEIQSVEGFAKGGDTKDRDYFNLAGEVEARNAARRTDKDMQNLIEDTEDVGRGEQVIKFKTASEDDISSVVKKYGITKDFREAGYILSDGSLLDLSGVAVGYHRHDGSRHVDHREIADAFTDQINGNDAMVAMVNAGAIRIMPESGGISISMKPSEKSLDALWDFIDYHDGEVEVDIWDGNGYTKTSAFYSEGTKPSRVINEIKNHFDNGEDLKGRGEQADGSIKFKTPGIYTGSAADYDKPSLVHVGTGEGSQVYGWGLYGSNQRGVAETYARIGRDALSLEHVMYDGKPLLLKGDSVEVRVGADLKHEGFDVDKLKKTYKSRLDNAIRELGEFKKLGLDTSLQEDMVSNYKDYYEFIVKNGDKFEKAPDTAPGEHVYEQTWFTNREPGDESHLLKWYEPVSEDNIKRIIDQYAKEHDGADIRAESPSGTMTEEDFGSRSDFVAALKEQEASLKENGGLLYNFLSKILKSPKAASEFLARADIDGIKYPVDSYGGKTVKDGDKAGWNYVSFRDDNITIDHKWVNGEMKFKTVSERHDEQMRTNAEYREVYEKLHGTKSWMKAPNGRPTNLDPVQWVQVRTQSFKKWFGDWENDPANASKVVDENGEPKVVYHGTRKFGFSNFDMEKAGSKSFDAYKIKGFYFSDNIFVAQSYTDSIANESPEVDSIGGDRTYYWDKPSNAEDAYYFLSHIGGKRHGNGVWEKMNSLIGKDEEMLQYAVNEWEKRIGKLKDEYADELYDKTDGIYGVFLNIRNPENGSSDGMLWSKIRSANSEDKSYDAYVGPKEFVSSAVKNGRDGVVVTDTVDYGSPSPKGYVPSTDYIIFSPNQIKSATDNVGTFSSSNNDIRFKTIADRIHEDAKKHGAVLRVSMMESGKPAYFIGIHGSPSAGFTKFNEGGVFLTDNIEVANSFSGNNNHDIYISKKAFGDDYDKVVEMANRYVNAVRALRMEELTTDSPDFVLKDNVTFYGSKLHDMIAGKVPGKDFIIDTDIASVASIGDMGVRGPGEYFMVGRMDRPLVIDCKGNVFSELAGAEVEYDYRDKEMRKIHDMFGNYMWNAEGEDAYTVAEFAKIMGFDGVVFKNMNDKGAADGAEHYLVDDKWNSNVAFVFNSKRVKLVDEHTADDNMEEIPVDSRMNWRKNDVRYKTEDHKYALASDLSVIFPAMASSEAHGYAFDKDEVRVTRRDVEVDEEADKLQRTAEFRANVIDRVSRGEMLSDVEGRALHILTRDTMAQLIALRNGMSKERSEEESLLAKSVENLILAERKNWSNMGAAFRQAQRGITLDEIRDLDVYLISEVKAEMAKNGVEGDIPDDIKRFIVSISSELNEINRQLFKEREKTAELEKTVEEQAAELENERARGSATFRLDPKIREEQDRKFGFKLSDNGVNAMNALARLAGISAKNIKYKDGKVEKVTLNDEMRDIFSQLLYDAGNDFDKVIARIHDSFGNAVDDAFNEFRTELEGDKSDTAKKQSVQKVRERSNNFRNTHRQKLRAVDGKVVSLEDMRKQVEKARERCVQGLADLEGNDRESRKTLGRYLRKFRDLLVNENPSIANKDIYQKLADEANAIDPMGEYDATSMLYVLSGKEGFDVATREAIANRLAELKAALVEAKKGNLVKAAEMSGVPYESEADRLKDYESRLVAELERKQRKLDEMLRHPQPDDKNLVAEINALKEDIAGVVAQIRVQKSELKAHEKREKYIEYLKDKLEKASAEMEKLSADNERTTETRKKEQLAEMSSLKADLKAARKEIFLMRSLDRQIAEYQRRIDERDFEQKINLRRPIESYSLQVQKLMLLRDRKRKEFEKAKKSYEYKKHALPVRVWKDFLTILGESKAIIGSLDLSSMWRQGGQLTWAHPLLFAKNFGKTLKVFMSDDYANRTMASIKLRKNWKYYEKAGIDFTDWGEGADNADDRFVLNKYRMLTRNKLVKMGVNASERAFSMYLNMMRADVFDAMVENSTYGSAEMLNDSQLQAIGRFINIASQRGAIDKSDALGSAIPFLNHILWSPRNVISRFQFLKETAKIAMPWADPYGDKTLRKMFAKELVRYITGVGAMIYFTKFIADMFKDDDDPPEDIEFDPHSSNFLKVKFGNTRVDMLSGLSQVIVFATRMTGKTKNLRGETKDTNRAETLGRFLRSKFSPAAGIVYDSVTGETFERQEIKWDSAWGKNENEMSGYRHIAEQFVPLILQDLYEQADNSGVDRTIVTGIMSILGAGVQAFDPYTYRQMKGDFQSYKRQYKDTEDESERQRLMTYHPMLRRMGSIEAQIKVCNSIENNIRKMKKANIDTTQMEDLLEKHRKIAVNLMMGVKNPGNVE